MKSFCWFVVLLTFVSSLSACRHDDDRNEDLDIKGDCDAPLTKWMKVSVGYNSKELAELAGKFQLTAKGDAEKLKVVQANASIDFSSGWKTAFERAAQGNKQAEVSQAFFEKATAYRQAVCNLERQIKKKIITNQEVLEKAQNLLVKLSEEFGSIKTKESVSVSIDRTSDFSGTKCSDGRRKYVHNVVDTLEFSNIIDFYEAQAYIGGGSHKALITYYQVGDSSGIPITTTSPMFQEGERYSVRIPINDTKLIVKYKFTSDPTLDDDQWGWSFVSSLPISKIHARALLPDGKQVKGLNNKYDTSNQSFSGCQLNPGPTPELKCNNGLSNRENVPNQLYWIWDVFEGC